MASREDDARSLALQAARAGLSARDTEDFVAAMLDEHRTHQQAFTRLARAWLLALAEHGRHDLRNEASVAMAKEIEPVLRGFHLPRI